jgi:hypothetical protein
MAVDYSKLALPKGRPAKLAKADRTKARKVDDETENETVKERSGGQCEVVWFGSRSRIAKRCPRRAAPGVHHMIGGWGKRARGKSLLAMHKQDVCTQCHSLITSHVLRRIGGDVPRWTDEYERAE